MTKSFKRSVLIAMLVALVALVAVAPASAMSASTKQVVPGVSERIIWDSAQVACYKLPNGVNHNGYIHMELKFKPSWADFDLYLLNEYGQTCSEEMGYMGVFTGKEVIDYRVTRINNQTIDPGDPYTTDDDYMVGDTYYVVVVAFNELGQFQISGYYPQIDLSVGSDTRNMWNYYLQSFRKPASVKSWIWLDGANYGYPYDFMPTSVGTGEARLEWPADIVKKQVTYDPVNKPSPANMEQYMYSGSNWNTVFENYGDANWSPPAQGDPPQWYGLLDTFAVEDGGGLGRPLRMMHYVPSLYLVASDPTMGGLAAPKVGKTTVGYKATLIWPENLRLKSAPARVRKGTLATLKGTFALNGAWQSGAAVKIQKNVGGTWKTVKTVRTDAKGNWTAKVRVTAATSFRAAATGDPATGLATEYSVTKRIRVR